MLFRKILSKHLPQKLKNAIHFLQALFAIIWFKYPAGKLKVIGVTGTDGKTTTSTLIYHLLKTAGKKVALVTSVAAYIGSEEVDTGFHVTTPDPWLLQKLLRKIRDMNFKYVVLETTSHALDQYRVLGTNMEIAVLTNITMEHSDYHKNYLNYVKAKSKIFTNVDTAIINKEDKSFSLVKKYIKEGTETISYDQNTTSLKVKKTIINKFPESYNRLNATAATLAVKKLGLADEKITRGLRTFPGVPGRMEFIKNNRGISVIIDFAHTPNALLSVLTALRKKTKKGKKLISVFGCASERDELKRPVMGKISTQIADVSIFTAEDPRYESVEKIILDMKKSIIKKKKPNKYYEIPDRAQAIDFAINKVAKRGDIIVICGKGHEKSMNYNGVEYPWSDKKAAVSALKHESLKGLAL